MANVKVNGTLLGATAASAHTVGAGMVVEFLELRLVNVHASDTVGYRVWFKPSGETLDDEHRVFATAGELSLGPGAAVVWPMWPHLGESDEIQWAATEASKIAASLSVREVSAGDAYKRANAQYLGSSLATLYTIPSGFQCTRAWVLACNQNTTAEAVEFQGVPNGQSAADRYKIITDSSATALEPGETRMLSIHPYWTVGDFLQGKAQTVDKVTVQAGFYLESV